jgi:GAF domain-containing protein
MARIIDGQRVVHIADVLAEDAYRNDPGLRRLIELNQTRTMLLVPLSKDGLLLGALTAFRQEVRPFSDKQIALLENFAAQTVIAMENARLLTETREALEQQTATAEVLQVINSSPGNLTPIFDAILEKAHTLCGAAHGALTIPDGEYFRAVATRGIPQAFAEILRQPFHPYPALQDRLLRGEDVVHVADLTQFSSDDSIYRSAVELGGVRTLLMVPLRKDGILLGYFTATRQEVQPFTDTQIALIQNFAAQAVIAMENARLITETREALEQQTATAEVLGVINSSPGDLAPVFDAMLEKATRLCEAPFGTLRTWDGEHFHVGAVRGEPRFVDWVRERGSFRPDRDGSPLRRIIDGEEVVHFGDAPSDTRYIASRGFREMVEISGMRSGVTVSLRKDDALLGNITVYRQEVRPFSDKQIALLQNFAAQAVIAMENARLLTETREALEQQTATAEVLQVINSSPGDLTPVFDAILKKAHDLCGAEHGVLVIRAGEDFRYATAHGEPSFVEALQQLGPPSARPAEGSLLARLMRGERVIHLADAQTDDSYRKLPPQVQRAFEVSGIRTFLVVPLLKDDAVLGFITAYRQEVRPFSENQITLLQNFATQAVIAMENARLITETREALEQQTATSEVLGIINSSPGNLAPVFDAILEKAHTLCEAAHGALVAYDGEHFRAVALRAMPEAFGELLRGPFRASEGGTAQQRLLRGEGLIHIPDVTVIEPANPIQPASIAAGIRTLLVVALRKDDSLLGYITAHRREVRPFTDKQIALLQNFAAQAVIAMENARLITETREALEQQTATAEVLQVINSSPGDLAPVFDAMLEKATSLCAGVEGALWMIAGQSVRLAATYGLPNEFVELIRQQERPEIGPNALLQKIMHGERIVHILDREQHDLYKTGEPLAKAAVERGKVRTLIWVALVKEGTPVGAFAIARREIRPFTEKQIALLQNFAAQAVIAMENARLLTETREALEQQTATAEVLQVINSSPGDLTPVFDAILDKAHTLCGAEFGSLFLYDGERFRAIVSHGVPEALASRLREGVGANDSRGSQQLIAGAPFAHIHDSALEEGVVYRGMDMVSNHRTLLSVPLRKYDALLGMIVAGRLEVRPFSEKQIALLQNFAAQAVIAMENARLLTETREALEQQTATAEVLQVINSSPGDLAPVFDAILEKAHTLCGAAIGALLTFDGESFGFLARKVPPDLAEIASRPFKPGPQNRLNDLIRGEPLLHILDAREVLALAPEDPQLRATVEVGGMRTFLAVPLRKDDRLIGTITAARQEVRPFTDKEITLLQNFAAQAVIAMENARLLTETREALEQQTATAEVLQVINSSPGDLAPVFDSMLEKGMRLCEAAFGVLWTSDGDAYRAAALRGVPPEFAEFVLDQRRMPEPDSALGQLASGKSFVHVADVTSRQSISEIVRKLEELGNIRTLLAVPLRKDGALLGAFHIYRQEVRPFSDKQIALLQNFAAQAVIAMENARLITETREALEQQTATAEVLQVINSSPGDLSPVFDSILDKAHSLCGVARGSLELYDGENLRAVATRGWADDFADQLRQGYPASDHPATRPLIEGRPFSQILGVMQHESPFTRGVRSGARTLLCVPLRRDDRLLGIITSGRVEVRPFSDKQITLLQNFAAQAVIAMENARLLNETREALEQQTATAEVLQVINASPGDLAPVFDAMLEKALRLCEADLGTFWTYDGEGFEAVALRGAPTQQSEFLRGRRHKPGRGTIHALLVAGEKLVHIPDAKDTEAYRAGEPMRRQSVDISSPSTKRLIPPAPNSRALNYHVRAFSHALGHLRPYAAV